nr:PHP domain-containing protein [Candidatus Wallbacteria bacterium]
MSPNREPASYVPLKCQTDHSVLRSCVKIDDLVACAAERAHSYLAICDLNNVSGYYDFYVKCRKNGIKPIIGAAIDVRDEIAGPGEKKELGHRITLYCKNYAGLLNLFKIINSINLSEGRTPVTSETIFKYQQGLICAFSNVSSAVYKLHSMKHAGEADRLLK